jgi:hypothetical protein
MLKAYKKEKGDWRTYEERFLGLMAERQIEKRLKPDVFDGACLLCSEDTPHHCHRRLSSGHRCRTLSNLLKSFTFLCQGHALARVESMLDTHIRDRN